MAIELSEYIGAIPVRVNTSKSKKHDLKESHVETCVDEASLMVDIEAIHSIMTRNYTFYSPKCLKDSVPYWTSPYEIPVIMHHKEKDGITIGRIKAANFIENSKRSGTAALELVANIGDEEGIKGIKNGTLATVSIGAIAHDITCSICGQNLTEEDECEHERGEIYNGKICYWIINKIEPKEVSYVIVPSDKYAHNTRVYKVKNKKNEVTESMTNIFDDLIKEYDIPSLKESAETNKVDVEEGVQFSEEVKDDAKVNTTETEGEEKEKAEEKKEEPEVTEEKKEKEEEKKVEEEKEESKPEEAEKKEEAEEKKEESEEVKEKEEEKELALEDEIKELKAQVATLEKENKKLKQRFENEKNLKECAEAELLQYKTAKKKALVEDINELRTQLSLPKEDAASLIESTEESLHATMKSLKEFVEVHKKTTKRISVLESPVAVSEDEDNTNKEKKVVKEVKESLKDSNNDLEKELLSLMANIF